MNLFFWGIIICVLGGTIFKYLSLGKSKASADILGKGYTLSKVLYWLCGIGVFFTFLGAGSACAFHFFGVEEQQLIKIGIIVGTLATIFTSYLGNPKRFESYCGGLQTVAKLIRSFSGGFLIAYLMNMEDKFKHPTYTEWWEFFFQFSGISIAIGVLIAVLTFLLFSSRKIGNYCAERGDHYAKHVRRQKIEAARREARTLNNDITKSKEAIRDILEE